MDSKKVQVQRKNHTKNFNACLQNIYISYPLTLIQNKPWKLIRFGGISCLLLNDISNPLFFLPFFLPPRLKTLPAL